LAVVDTPFDEQEKGYLDLISKATTVEEVSAAKSQLNNLAQLKWDAVPTSKMVAEIDSRFADQDKGIYTASYKSWKATYETGTEDEVREAAKTLLKTSDKIIYSTVAKEKTNAIKEEQDRLAGENKVETGGTGTATLSGGSAYTVTQDADGVFTLVKDDTSVTVKEGTVIGGRVDTSSLEQDVTLLDRRTAWVDTNTEYHRIKTAEGFAVDSAIIKRYYSVIDAEVYFGNEYVEDVHDINWAVQQNVQPLFGYNSYTYDEVARGNRLIVGNFTIVFTSPNYLFSILSAAAKANGAMVENMASYSVPKLSDSIEPSFRSGAYGSRETGHHGAMWPQTFDIDIILGEKSSAGDPVHVIILGVAIQNCQTVLSASAAGTPPAIMEQYSFIARDIKTSVLSATGKNTEAPANSNTATVSASTGDDNTVKADTVTQAEATALGKTVEELQKERDEEAQKKAKEKAAVEEAQKLKEEAEGLGDTVKARMDKYISDGVTSLSSTDDNGNSSTYKENSTLTVKELKDELTGSKTAGYEMTLSYPNAVDTNMASQLAALEVNRIQTGIENGKYTWQATGSDDKTITYTVMKKDV
jgi:hypothetical protein